MIAGRRDGWWFLQAGACWGPAYMASMIARRTRRSAPCRASTTTSSGVEQRRARCCWVLRDGLGGVEPWLGSWPSGARAGRLGGRVLYAVGTEAEPAIDYRARQRRARFVEEWVPLERLRPGSWTG